MILITEHFFLGKLPFRVVFLFMRNVIMAL